MGNGEMVHRNRWFTYYIIAWWIFPWRTVSHNLMVKHENMHQRSNLLIAGDWSHGILYDFPIMGMYDIPNWRSHIFQGWLNHQPHQRSNYTLTMDHIYTLSLIFNQMVETTNQINIYFLLTLVLWNDTMQRGHPEMANLWCLELGCWANELEWVVFVVGLWKYQDTVGFVLG